MCKKILYISLGLSSFVGNLAFSENLLQMRNRNPANVNRNSIFEDLQPIAEKIAKIVLAKTQNNRSPAAIGQAIDTEINSIQTFHRQMANLIANNRNKLENMVLLQQGKSKLRPLPPQPPPSTPLLTLAEVYQQEKSKLRKLPGEINRKNNTPPPPPPPPPPPAPPPPPPPPLLPLATNLDDAIKQAGQQLKPVQPVDKSKQPVDGYLDLIKQGGFQLKKVRNGDANDPKTRQPVKPKGAPTEDPNVLHQSELVTKLGKRREAIVNNDDDDDESDSEKSESTEF
jgi:hypothetical protein